MDGGSNSFVFVLERFETQFSGCFFFFFKSNVEASCIISQGLIQEYGYFVYVEFNPSTPAGKDLKHVMILFNGIHMNGRTLRFLAKT